MGITNFYSQYTEGYREKCMPLYNLEKKNQYWRWGEIEQQAINDVKSMLAKEVELTYPDFTKDFHIQIDASEAVVRAHLYQIDNDNKIKTIAFMIKTMQASELNYTVTEKELLAIIYAIKKFYNIIAGYKTKICTDHKALIFLNLCKNPTPRIIRWLLYLQPLKLEFAHIEGKNNCIADALSRNPVERDEINIKDKIFNINNLSTKEFKEFIEKIKIEQAEDESC